MSDADLILYWRKRAEEIAEELRVARGIIAGQEAEIREGDFWQERARQSFANGTCPTCFCTDEGPHEKGCYIAELRARLAVLEKVAKWADKLEISMHRVDRDGYPQFDAFALARLGTALRECAALDAAKEGK